MNSDEIEQRILQLKADSRLLQNDANVQINAPLAMEQVSLKTELHTLEKVLGLPLTNFNKLRSNPMITIKENDVYKRERKEKFTNVELITLKIPEPCVYVKSEHDWYMTIALERVDKIEKDRDLLTSHLIISFRNAIREGYQQQLDHALSFRYAHPSNRHSVKGIQQYIERINKKRNH